MPNIQSSLGNSVPDNSSKQSEFKKNIKFRILQWTSFLMIPLTFLYDENIDRPKMSEQKNPFEYKW